MATKLLLPPFPRYRHAAMQPAVRIDPLRGIVSKQALPCQGPAQNSEPRACLAAALRFIYVNGQITIPLLHASTS